MRIDIFDWIKNIINSCTDTFHFEGVDRLIDLYYEKEKHMESFMELKKLRDDKWNEVHTILH